MARLRSYVSGFLVLILVLTGHSAAIARGMPGPAGYVEYCLGEAAVIVPVDDQGNPVGPVHICPELSLSLLDWVAPAPAALPPVTLTVSRAVVRTQTQDAAIRAVQASARAPPAFT